MRNSPDGKRTGYTNRPPAREPAAAAAGAGLGPGTEGMRREAVMGSTGEVRQGTKSLRSGPAARGGVSREAG